MIIFYNLGIKLYWFIALLISPFNTKARLWVMGRTNTFSKMEAKIEKGAKIAWFHAASLGEFEQGRPLMEAFRKEKPGYKILLTFFSPSGYEVRKNYQGADYIFYLPLDTQLNAKRFISIVNPSLVIFIKYEFWHYYLNEVFNKNIPLYLVSAIFRNNQVFFRSYGKWYRKILKSFTHLFVQDTASVDLLKSIGINNVTYAGDTRFDRVAQIAASCKDIDVIEEFAQNKFTFVFGSTWPEDEDLLVKYINNSPGDLRFIIAPHEIQHSHIINLAQKLKVKYILHSQAAGAEISKARVIIIDNIGMLSSLYKYGKIAYIGGGFGAGIHNILEAAVYGMPVIFGPKYQKFREAQELIADGGAFSISSFDELKNIFENLTTDTQKLQNTSAIAKEYIIKNLGATDKIINFLTEN